MTTCAASCIWLESSSSSLVPCWVVVRLPVRPPLKLKVSEAERPGVCRQACTTFSRGGTGAISDNPLSLLQLQDGVSDCYEHREQAPAGLQHNQSCPLRGQHGLHGSDLHETLPQFRVAVTAGPIRSVMKAEQSLLFPSTQVLTSMLGRVTSSTWSRGERSMMSTITVPGMGSSRLSRSIAAARASMAGRRCKTTCTGMPELSASSLSYKWAEIPEAMLQASWRLNPMPQAHDGQLPGTCCSKVGAEGRRGSLQLSSSTLHGQGPQQLTIMAWAQAVSSRAFT